jgi:hypothetical protein
LANYMCFVAGRIRFRQPADQPLDFVGDRRAPRAAAVAGIRPVRSAKPPAPPCDHLGGPHEVEKLAPRDQRSDSQHKSNRSVARICGRFTER